jgi:hypothetical protein
MRAIAVACGLAFIAAVDVAAVEPAKTNSFGIKPEWVASPAMLDALERLQQAGVVAGRRGSLTFFRWSNTEPPKLAHLGLWGPQITNDLLSLTAQLPDLEYVSLYETDVDDDGIAALAGLPKLRRLTLAPICRYEKTGFGPPQWSYPFMAVRDERPHVTARGLQAFAAIATLEAVELLDARLASRDLALLKSWPKLSAVSLPNAIDAEAVRHLQACRRLNQLTLGYREITVEELKRLSEWPGLRRLTLIHARLSDEALAAFASLTTLEELRLEDCDLTDERLRRLQLAAATKSLLLERNEIDGPGLKHLVRLAPTTLGLEFNNLRDETLNALPPLTSVVDLRLAYCRGITDRGIQSGTLQQMTNLKRLNLRGLKQVTNAALGDLEKFSRLEHIGLRETSVDANAVRRLRAALPNTDVFK